MIFEQYLSRMTDKMAFICLLCIILCSLIPQTNACISGCVCSAGDFLVLYPKLVPDPGSCACTSNEQYPLNIEMTLRNGAASERYCVRLFYTLIIDHKDGTTTTYPASSIYLSEMVDGKTDKVVTVQFPQQYTCGDSIELTALTVAWDTKGQWQSHGGCPATPYYGCYANGQSADLDPLYIPTPLNSKINSELNCDIIGTPPNEKLEYTFTATSATGGTPPYVYSWTTSDGQTATGQDATFQFPIGAHITVTLKVRDNNGNTPYCEFTASKTFDVFKPYVQIDAHPQPVNVCPGEDVSFSVTATGTNIVYQWYKDGVILANDPPHITGVTDSTLYIDNVSPEDEAYTPGYTVVVDADNCCSTTSSSAPLTLKPYVPITVQPRNVLICDERDVQFSVTATGTGLTYQWYKNGVALSDDPDPNPHITGATSNTLTIHVATSADAASSPGYTVEVSAPTLCSFTSNAATLRWWDFPFADIILKFPI
jgi:hypothetical protein